MSRRALSTLALTLLVGCEGQITQNPLGPNGVDRNPRSPVDASVATAQPDRDGGAGSLGDASTVFEPTDPGRVTMRRLNRAELDYTVRDLLLLDHPVSADFPSDDIGYGFDNNGDVLSTSALHIELLAQEAEKWVDEGIGSETVPGPARSRYFDCAPSSDASCAAQIVEGFAARAWRRPVRADELQRIRSTIGVAGAHARPLEEGIHLAMTAVLTSPNFWFRAEPMSGATPLPIGDYALASRLSYFLWASTPDDTLLDLASRGALDDDATLVAQVSRMLEDSRSDSLVRDFAGQWLWTRGIPDHVVDYDVYGDWSPELAASARTEIEMFFEAFLREDLPVEEMVTADFSFVDTVLARHYQMTPPSGSGFSRVTMPEPRQAGILARAGILAMTSQPDRTSPVKRGVWVLEQLLCTHPPPPPPNVEGFESTEPRTGETLRQRFERHRADPACAACHALMDPIGFGLERFDGIGRYREREDGTLIDDTGTLVDGSEFAGAVELASAIGSDPRFAQCVSRQLLTYALGRGMRDGSSARTDSAWITKITEAAQASGGSLRDVITQIVLSAPFRTATPEMMQ